MPLQQETSPAVAAPRDGVCYFDKLPQELLAVVCSLTYGHATAKRLMLKQEYESTCEELVKAGTLASVPPFVHYVNKYLVSKRFFLCAVEAFVKAQQVDLINPATFHIVVKITDQMAFQLFARSCKLYTYAASRLTSFVNLRNVYLEVVEISFERTTSTTKKYPWLHVFQDSDFEEIKFVKHLSTLRGLRTLTCKGTPPRYADTKTKKQIWKDNISALQNYLMPIVTARRQACATAISSSPTKLESLYPGSSVSGIGCKPTLLATPSEPIDLVPSMATEVLDLKPEELRRWVERALREKPVLARPI